MTIAEARVKAYKENQLPTTILENRTTVSLTEQGHVVIYDPPSDTKLIITLYAAKRLNEFLTQMLQEDVRQAEEGR